MTKLNQNFQDSYLYEIDGYGVVLPHVQNYYPVEKDEKVERFCWGFKYISGVFEFFYYKTEEEAVKAREGFKLALEQCWLNTTK